MNLNAEDMRYLIKTAETAERYDEMVDYVIQLTMQRLNNDEELNDEERTHLSVAFKNVVGSRRASWRVLSSIQGKEDKKGNAGNVQKIRTYKGKIEEELRDLCNKVLDLLGAKLIPKTKSDEGRVFYMKMRGDYYRYIAEFSSGGTREGAA